VIVYDKLFIGGRWAEPATTELLDIRSPRDRGGPRPSDERATGTPRESNEMTGGLHTSGPPARPKADDGDRDSMHFL
jgi:hypothetical protein